MNKKYLEKWCGTVILQYSRSHDYFARERSFRSAFLIFPSGWLPRFFVQCMIGELRGHSCCSLDLGQKTTATPNGSEHLKQLKLAFTSDQPDAGHPFALLTPVQFLKTAGAVFCLKAKNPDLVTLRVFLFPSTEKLDLCNTRSY